MSQLERRAEAPERWEPLNELEQVTQRMRRLLEQTFGGFGWPSTLAESVGWSPPVDIEEQDEAFLLEAELPGVKREDVNIELVGNELAITGEVKQPERTGTIRQHTRKSGRFSYRLSLPAQVDADQIEATLNDGMLTIRVPKSERAQRRRIALKS